MILNIHYNILKIIYSIYCIQQIFWNSTYQLCIVLHVFGGDISMGFEMSMQIMTMRYAHIWTPLTTHLFSGMLFHNFSHWKTNEICILYFKQIHNFFLCS